MGGTYFDNYLIDLQVEFLNHQEFLSWYTSPAFHEAVSTAEKEVTALVRKNQAPSEYRSYQNWTRDAPIEHLYVGKERLERLKALKEKWDPTGVFTRLFLD